MKKVSKNQTISKRMQWAKEHEDLLFQLKKCKGKDVQRKPVERRRNAHYTSRMLDEHGKETFCYTASSMTWLRGQSSLTWQLFIEAIRSQAPVVLVDFLRHRASGLYMVSSKYWNFILCFYSGPLFVSVWCSHGFFSIAICTMFIIAIFQQFMNNHYTPRCKSKDSREQ